MKTKNRLQQLLDKELRPSAFLEEIGMTKSALSLVLNGRRLPQDREAEKLAQFAGISKADVIGLLAARVAQRAAEMQQAAKR